MARRSLRYGVLLNSVPKFVKNISDIGINYDIIAQTRSTTYDEEEDLFSSGIVNTNNLYNTVVEPENPYYASTYEEKRRYLRRFAGYTEIEYILDCICDDSIVSDKYNRFCSPNINNSKLLKETSNQIKSNFDKIYSMLDFDSNGTAWKKYREWLIDGCVAYEIVYDYKKRSELNANIANLRSQLSTINDNIQGTTQKSKRLVLENEAYKINKKLRKLEVTKSVFESYRCVNKETNELDDDLIPVRIIGFVELDPKHLTPVDVEDTDYRTSNNLKLWKYDKYREGKEIVLSDNQLIYVNYYDENTTGNISYVERLIRNFNLKRKLEDSTVGWFIMNSQSRLKIIVPIGNKTTGKAKQALRNLTNHYQEDLLIDFNSGEVTVNGQPRISYSRNIVLPSRNGSSPSVDTLTMNGPDLSNMKVVDYFDKNLRKDSRLPASRYDRDKADSKVVLFKADSVTYEDLSYYSFIDRLRSVFSEIILKPVRIQTILDIPELKVDPSFKTSFGLEFNSNFMFEEAKQAELLKARLDIVKLYDGVKGDNDKPAFSKKFLYVTKYKIFTEEEWNENERMLKDKDEEGSQSMIDNSSTI